MRQSTPHIIQFPITHYPGGENGHNKKIRQLLQHCGIDRPIREYTRRVICRFCIIASSHLARRTFIGNLYKKVKDPNLVGSLNGHKKGSKAFARYRDIDEATKKELVSLID